MAKLSLDEIANSMQVHEEKFLTAEKVADLRKEVSIAKKYMNSEDEEFSFSDALKCEFLNKTAYLRDGYSLGRASNLSHTTKKLVVASDYLSKEREDEACAILGNALEAFNQYANANFPFSDRRELEKKQEGAVYEAIEQRALRGAKKTYTQNIKLGKEFVEVAEKAKKVYTQLRNY